MNEFWTRLFDASGFSPEGTGWTAFHAGTELISDVFISAAYLVISCTLAYFLWRRKDVPFPYLFWLFGGLILLSGIVYLVDIILFYFPVYRFATIVKVITALTGGAVVIAMIFLIPKILSLASPQALRADIERRTQEMRDSEARLSAIVATAKDGILTLDEEWTILTVNPVCEQMFGLPSRLMVGRPFTDLISGPDSESAVKKQMETGEGKVFGMGGDVLAKRADGTTFPASLAMSKVDLGHGRIFTAIIHDVTTFKKTQEALRQSEARLRLMLAQVPAILCSTDRKLRVAVFASSATTGLSSSGFLIKRFSGMSLLDSEDEILRLMPARAFQQALENKHVSVGVRWGDRFFQFHVQALRDTEGTIIGAIGIGLDVTTQKRIEDALRRSNEELDEFAYITSHDLKEPLRGIHNYCKFLNEDYGDTIGEEGQKKLLRLQHLANHMNNLVESLHEFSRVGRIELAVRYSNLNHVLGDILDSLHLSLQENNVQIRIPHPLPTIRCDQVRIAEVFRNLITNAIKYNDKPEKWIEIGEADPDELTVVRHMELNKELVRQRVFYVRDNGIGIDPKHWDEIFRIFKRLHGENKYGGGTGAGLTIVKKIIERHGGHIFLESEPRQGTTFYFTIPEAPSEKRAEPLPVNNTE